MPLLARTAAQAIPPIPEPTIKIFIFLEANMYKKII
jgi:hypothetical protein